MGMDLTLIALSATEFEQCASDQDKLVERSIAGVQNAIGGSAAGDALYLDKNWHALHYLLSGTADEAPLPQGALLGGSPVGEDMGNGPARYLSVAEVQGLVSFLSEARRPISAAELDRHEIYPGYWTEEGEEMVEEVYTSFEQLKTFANACARSGKTILMVMS